MSISRKEISFDLDTKSLANYYDNVSSAYYDLRIELKKAGFTHRQGSVYNSVLPMNRIQISNAMNNICYALPWLSDCAKSIDVTSICSKHSLKADVNASCEKYVDCKERWLDDLKSRRKSH